MSSKGQGLPINAVIIVLAVIVLVTVIGIIYKINSSVEDSIPTIIDTTQAVWMPTPQDPVKFSPSRPEIRAGRDKEVRLQVYNYGGVPAMCNIGFVSSNPADDMLTFQYFEATQDIPPGKVGEWKVNIGVPSDTPAQTYMYAAEVDCGSFEKREEIFIPVI